MKKKYLAVNENVYNKIVEIQMKLNEKNGIRYSLADTVAVVANSYKIQK